MCLTLLEAKVIRLSTGIAGGFFRNSAPIYKNAAELTFRRIFAIPYIDFQFAEVLFFSAGQKLL